MLDFSSRSLQVHYNETWLYQHYWSDPIRRKLEKLPICMHLISHGTNILFREWSSFSSVQHIQSLICLRYLNSRLLPAVPLVPRLAEKNLISAFILIDISPNCRCCKNRTFSGCAGLPWSGINQCRPAHRGPWGVDVCPPGTNASR